MNRRRVGDLHAPREVHLLELLASAEVLRGAVRQGLALLEVHALEVLAYGGADFNSNISETKKEFIFRQLILANIKTDLGVGKLTSKRLSSSTP